MTNAVLRLATVGFARAFLAATLFGRVMAADVPDAAAGPPPANPPALEKRVREAMRKVTPAVVSVNGASGVVVTTDGVVLSQWHVTHQRGGKPGTKTKVLFADGSEAEAVLLGADPLYDLSALKLTGPGPYAHAPLAGSLPEPGDPVLQLGHPYGLQNGHPPVVRLGRVLLRAEDTLVTDCGTAGGDSGGPYVDLDGRVVGIIRDDNVPGRLAAQSGEPISRGVRPFSATPAPFIGARLAALKRPEVGQPAAGASEKLRLDVAALTAPVLAADRWAQGRSTRALFAAAAASARGSVVEVLDGDLAVALGTVVDPSGLIVTAAGAAPDGPRCRLPDGRVVPAAVLGVDPAYHLALLRVEAGGLTPVGWSSDKKPPAGTLLAAPAGGELPIAVGVVSVPRLDPPGPHATAVARDRHPAAPPEVAGRAVQGLGYWVEFADGNAAAAGLRPGDLIVTIGGVPIRSHQDLLACAASRRAGEKVTVRALREGRPTELALSLLDTPGGWKSGGWSDAPPPVAFWHDMPLTARECGGPVIGLDGKALGVTVARVGEHGCVAVPADVVAARLADLKSGKPLAGLPPPRSAPAPAGQPVKISAEEIKAKLRERGERFRSLLVEYDVVDEQGVDPGLLMGWRAGYVRDYSERHRVAFSGPKRLTDVAWPALELRPSPAAGRQGRGAREPGSIDHLFIWRQAPQRNRSLCDGTACFAGQLVGNSHFPIDPGYFYAPEGYLSNLGLRPVDPKPADRDRASQESQSFPGNFARYESVRVRPAEEAVDGAGCVVLDGEYAGGEGGKGGRVTETLWLDPSLGYAPRRWEARAGGRLLWRRENADFREFAAGCWLPLEAVWAVADQGGQTLTCHHMRLRWARVNDVPEAVFDPDQVFKP